MLFTLAIIAALAFIAYKVVQQVEGNIGPSGDSSDSSNLAQIDQRLADIESRLGKLETARRTAVPTRQNAANAEADPPPTAPLGRTLYRVTPPQASSRHTGEVAPSAAEPDTARSLSALRQGLGTVQNEQTANREALEATTDKLADMAGQVGAQSVQILQNQDELNQLLSQSERQAIPFELSRGSNPVPIGPVSFILRTSNQKTLRYSLCIYIRPSCIELKDKTLNEVVQFVVSRNTTPLQLVATRILKNQIVGYLEVPRIQATP
jgi:hypothetical protein